MEERRNNVPAIMVVDDDQGIIESFQALLEDSYSIITAKSGEEAMELLKKHDIKLILLDIMMPGIDGIETLEKIKVIDRSIDVIMLTAVKEIRTAIKAMKLGAYDYVTKPFDIDEIKALVDKIFEKQEMEKEVIYLRSALSDIMGFDDIVGESSEMCSIYEAIKEVAKNDSTVVITGESGTGKELVARAIHNNSPRKNRPFVAVDCATIGENLFESVLFGHEKGSFTDATEQKTGRFELANSGTVFLDEIGNMSLTMQGKILRVLQEKEFQRLGGTKTIKLDVRILSATNIDLPEAVKQGSFREELYYRLNVVPIQLPPLRDKVEDIPLLVEHFIKMYNTKYNKHVKGVSVQAMNFLKNYNWPGNVRELKNVIERIIVLGKSKTIYHKRLPLDILLSKEVKHVSIEGKEKLPLKYATGQFEKKYILDVLKKTNWNQTKASMLMGIHRNTLILKMQALGIRGLRDIDEDENEVENEE